MKAYLVLQNGRVFEGNAIGAVGETVGELVFTTGMGGYIETLTDPCYFGQIVMQTFPQIGNYGMIAEDMLSYASAVRGYVVRELCDAPANFRCEGDLEDFLKEQGIVGIAGVDTRELTCILREEGVMNAAIVSDPESFDKALLSEYKVKNALSSVAKEEYILPAAAEEKYSVALLDCGAKTGLAEELQKRGCEVSVLPYDSSAEEILGFDGLVISDGAGDPRENELLIAELQKLFGKLPILGIGLGHQLLALAAGGKTCKLKCGHRGTNQPVKCLADGNVYITSQNHGYAVDMDSLPAFAVVNYININDGTCEGVCYEEKKAFSVQFSPVSCTGAREKGFLFDEFLNMLGGDE